MPEIPVLDDEVSTRLSSEALMPRYGHNSKVVPALGVQATRRKPVHA